MLLPALNNARETSRNAACKNNMKQIGMAGGMYRGDYDSWFEPVSVPESVDTYARAAQSQALLSGYKGASNGYGLTWDCAKRGGSPSFSCPSSQNIVWYNDTVTNRVYFAEYGPNFGLCGELRYNLTRPHKTTSVVSASQAIYYGELFGVNDSYITSHATLAFRHGGSDPRPITNGAALTSDQMRVQLKGKNNFTFVDGHVEGLTANEYYARPCSIPHGTSWQDALFVGIRY